MNMNLSRRSLLGLSAAAAATALSASPAQAAVRPAVLWGSSSARGLYADQPNGFRKVSLWGELTALGVPTAQRGFSTWTSDQILAVRSEDHPIRPDFTFAGARETLPSSGSLVLPVTKRSVLPGGSIEIPGTIDGVPVTLSRAQSRFNKILLTRTAAGAPVHVGASPKWVTGLEKIERGKTHLLWLGKNNIGDTAGVIADTKAAYDVEPKNSLVLGHWMNWHDRRGTTSHAAVNTVNSAYKRTYGSRYVDIQAAMWSRQLWADLPEIRALGLAKTYADGKRQALGSIPREFIATDSFHLNAYGYLVAAHAVHRKLQALGWA